MSQIVLEGDARKVLQDFPDGFFHCAVTSPPYYSPKKGSRNYGVRPLEWEDGWIGDLGKEPYPIMYADQMIWLGSHCSPVGYGWCS